jgi:hypothetical protein
VTVLAYLATRHPARTVCVHRDVALDCWGMPRPVLRVAPDAIVWPHLPDAAAVLWCVRDGDVVIYTVPPETRHPNMPAHAPAKKFARPAPTPTGHGQQPGMFDDFGPRPPRPPKFTDAMMERLAGK